MSYNELVNEKAHRAERGLKMMYSEFVEGTGCKDNEKNYEVFKNLEVMYMNSDMTKEQIYEYGKKLVDNSKSEEEIRLENQINEEIKYWKNEIERYNREIAWAKAILQECKADGNKDLAYFRKNDIRFYTEQKKDARGKIAALKWVLG